MAAVNGTNGNFTFAAGYVANVKSFSMDDETESLESTAFASAGQRDFIAGLQTWSGTYECLLDGTTVLIRSGTSGAAVLTASTGRTYSGTILVTRAGVRVAVDGINMVSFAFKGKLAMTPA